MIPFGYAKQCMATCNRVFVVISYIFNKNRNNNRTYVYNIFKLIIIEDCTV